MTNKEQIQNMSIDELANWLDDYGRYEDSPWNLWFIDNFCDKCDPVYKFLPYLGKESECAYCEDMNRCRFFPKMADAPNSLDVVKMWLENDVYEENKQKKD